MNNIERYQYRKRMSCMQVAVSLEYFLPSVVYEMTRAHCNEMGLREDMVFAKGMKLWPSISGLKT